ncbi:hypothetical protein M9Y10_019531 [Tritrichomonas musculus]|uniref:Methyltransferase type 11 domain-containing protein n=1 Tax=Tritrichomonas musculus TaxID=1915356 RepID=A0ABR2HGP9_9EUKA
MTSEIKDSKKINSLSINVSRNNPNNIIENEQNTCKSSNIETSDIKSQLDCPSSLDEDLRSKILTKYKNFQQETGCTDEELLDLVMDIETEKIEEEDLDKFIERNDFGSHDYWEKRYTESKTTFEWYFKWNTIERAIKPFLKGRELVLNIGCGNSEVSEDMIKGDIETVVSIDISQVVIDQMSEKCKNINNMYWYKMDCTDMEFKDDLFDIVFDKGTFDAILCGDNNMTNIRDSLCEIWRVLKNGGFFIEVTHSEPKKRINILNCSGENWKFHETRVIEGNSNNGSHNTKNYYIYILEKIENAGNNIETNK